MAKSKGKRAQEAPNPVNLHPEYEEDVPYEGDGKEGCQRCRGKGVVKVKSPAGVPMVQRCPCARKKDLLYNMERGWPNLVRANKVKESPLDDYVKDTLWVRVSVSTFRAYLRRTAINMGPRWRFKVVTDVDLMNSWLSNLKAKGMSIYDFDVAQAQRLPSQQFPSLVDLVQPPALLIILAGVKVGRNSAMPEVFAESLKIRQHMRLPTWVVDQPHRPLSEGHLCWSQDVDDYMSFEWEHYYLDLREHILPSARKRRNARKYTPKPKLAVEMLTEGHLDEGALSEEEELLEEEQAQRLKKRRTAKHLTGRKQISPPREHDHGEEDEDDEGEDEAPSFGAGVSGGTQEFVWGK